MTNNKLVHVKTDRQIEVLKAADRVHVNGAVNAGDIARELGDTAPGATNQVNQIIVTLRKHGEWPYQSMPIPRAKEILDFNGPGDPELDVLSECYRRLCTLATQERARVLRYLRDRLEPAATTETSH